MRVVTAALGLFSLGAVCAAYVIAWLAIPDQGSGQTGADQLYDRYGDYQRRRDARQSGGEPDNGPADTFSAD